MEDMFLIEKVRQLAGKAKLEIPQMPIYTWNFENYHVSISFRQNKRITRLSLRCTPPSTEDLSNPDKMVVNCEVYVPYSKTMRESALMYEPIPTVLERIGTAETIEQMVVKFRALIKDIRDYEQKKKDGNNNCTSDTNQKNCWTTCRKGRGGDSQDAYFYS